MKARKVMRLRMTIFKKRLMPNQLLIACILLLLFIVYAMSKLPSIRSFRHMNDEEAENYYGKESYRYFEGKCNIRNFERLRHMSIVYTWVNGSQPCYRQMRIKHGGKNAVGGSRDREVGELMYSIRSFVKNVPWHKGNFYIVTPGHIPHWLDLDNPRIKIINQDDLFPDYAKPFLPTFNTHVIEQFLYLIPGLSDIFMQVNDDYIFAKSIAPHDFFTCDGGIRLLHERNLISHKAPTPKKGIWISSVLNTQQEMDLRWGQQDRYYIKHAPFVYSRRAFARVHEIFDRPLYSTLKSRFRGKPDMNMPLLHHYYLASQGSGELGIPIEIPPTSELQDFKLILMKNDNIKELETTFTEILENKVSYKVLALNDEYTDMRVARVALDFLEKLLPKPSEFERAPGSPDHALTIRKADTCEIDTSIMAPIPSRPDEPPQYEIIAISENHSTSFMNAFFSGLGAGLGLIIAYLCFSMRFRVNSISDVDSSLRQIKESSV